MNMRLRVHLPLIVPGSGEQDDCAIRVGNTTRPWATDKALVFDDSYNHEAWNRTEHNRVLLLVDIWHPDIALEEKQEIVKMFQEARQQGMWKR
jgi:aspartyl/asparaginyl beta-hydroxylase (cupin superfamily)